MKEFLEWIEQEGYVLHKERSWYKKGSYRPWQPIVYLKPEQLIELYEKSFL
jgi:hypothetical protein